MAGLAVTITGLMSIAPTSGNSHTISDTRSSMSSMASCAAAGAPRSGCKNCGPGPQAIDSEGLLERLPPGLAERI